MTQSELETVTPPAARPQRLNLWLNIALGVLLIVFIAGGAFFGYTVYQDRQTQASSSATGRLITLLTAQIRKSPNDAILRVRLGEAYGALNRYPEAIEQLNAAIKIQPKHSGAYLDLGMIAMLTNNNKVAENYFQKVLSLTEADQYSQLNTVREQALYNLGTITLSEKRYSDAAGFFKAALFMRRDASDTYYQLARALDGLGATDDAIAQLEIGIQFDPGFAEAHYFLGQLYQKKKDDVNASYQIAQAVKLAPSADQPQQALEAFGPASDWIAKANKALNDNDVEAALKFVLVARNLDEKSFDAAKLHGSILVQRGDLKDALEVYKAAAKLNPKDAGVKAEIATLTKQVAALTPAKKAAAKKAAVKKAATTQSTTNP
jgi:tetratricopeptide (TPR) repeat protein